MDISKLFESKSEECAEIAAGISKILNGKNLSSSLLSIAYVVASIAKNYPIEGDIILSLKYFLKKLEFFINKFDPNKTDDGLITIEVHRWRAGEKYDPDISFT